MADETKKSLIARLAEACAAVKGLEKKGKNEKQNYKYLKAADVAKAIRHEFFSRNIVLMFDEKDFTQIRTIRTNSGGEMGEFLLKAEVTFFDGESTDKLGPFGAFGVAMDTGDKAIWKAKTGALKYVLRGIGLIPDEKDDPEADEKVDYETSPDTSLEKHERAFEERAEGEQTLALFQQTGLHDLCKTHGRTEAQMLAYMKAELGVERIDKVLRRDFEKLKLFVLGRIPVQDALETSVETARAITEAKQARGVTEKQIARLFAIARKQQVPEEDIKTYISENYGEIGLKELSMFQYDSVVKWVEGA